MATTRVANDERTRAAGAGSPAGGRGPARSPGGVGIRPGRQRRGLARRAAETAVRLEAEYPGRAVELCALHHANPFQLLVATILSAQCTDERVNQVTPELFRRYPTAADLAAADPAELEELIRSTGFFRSKTRSLLGMAGAVAERFGGEVPSALDELVTLPGVGRKTANVVRSVAFDLPGLPVDTHVARVSRRLGLTSTADPAKAEAELCTLLPSRSWGALSLRLILHGRAICQARSPRCASCVLADLCPSAQLLLKKPGKNSPRTRAGRGREAVS